MRSWRASIDTPHALVAALHIRDAAALDVVGATPGTPAVPPLEPAVALDPQLVPHATWAAAAAWSGWWGSMLNRHPEFRGVPPLVPDPFPELDVDLRALIGVGQPAADQWFNARKHEDIEELRRTGRPGPFIDLNGIVRGVEEELGRTAAPFDLVISVLPVAGLWGSRVRRDHVLISRTLSRHRGGVQAFLEPVVRELAQEP